MFSLFCQIYVAAVVVVLCASDSVWWLSWPLGLLSWYFALVLCACESDPFFLFFFIFFFSSFCLFVCLLSVDCLLAAVN